MDTEANSLIDWLGFVNAVNINSTPHTPVTQTHAGFAGFSPDGISKYINGGLLQGDMVKTNTFTHEYIFENLSANNAKLFGTSGNDGRAYQLSQSTQPDVRGQCNYFTTITSNPTLELFQNNSLYGIDNIALTVRIFKNGVSLNSAPVALLGNGNLPFYHGAFNSNGTAVQFLNSKLCMAVSGASVGFDHLAFYNRTLAFLQDLGIE
jgi:hypothetical protein